MKSLIWKELRENLNWVALLVVGFCAALAYALYTSTRPYYNVAPLTSPAFQMSTVIGCPAIALAIGLLQTLRENRRDQWAFLIHRPLSRSRIFLAKIIAGLILYVAACGIPLLILTIYVATPGHVPVPFLPGMLLPVLADALAGFGYYFIAYLIALRHARWFGSRLLPIGLPLIASICAAAFEAFWMAALGASLVMLLCALAAYGTFLASGEYTPLPRPSKFATFLANGIGATLVGILAFAIVAGLAEPRQPYTYRQYLITTGGQLVIATYSDGVVTTVTDLAGHPLNDAHAKEFMTSPAYHYSRGLASVSLQLQGMWYPSSYRQPYRYYADYGNPGGVHWYYLFDRHLLVGYDVKSNRWIASAGKNGLVATPQLPEPFPETALHPWGGYASYGEDALLIFPSIAYRLDLFAQRMRPLFVSPPGEQIRDLETPIAAEDRFFAALTTSSVHILDLNGKSLIVIPLIPNEKEYGQVVVGHLTNGNYYLWYGGNWHIPDLHPTVLTYSPTGQLLSRTDLPDLDPLGDRAPALSEMLGVPLVPPIVFIIAFFLRLIVSGHAPWMNPQHHASAREIVMFGACVAIPILCAVGTWLITSRYNFSRRRKVLWTITNLLFAVPGLVTMLLTLDWPRRVECPSCKRPRLTTRESCESCASPFPAPALEGIEIFS